MPWKASSVMEERLRFVARLLEGEPMSDLCREFGISRKTGYKIFTRYQEHGCAALTDRSQERSRKRRLRRGGGGVPLIASQPAPLRHRRLGRCWS